MGEIKSYKDLLIWQKGIELSILAYEVCKTLPKEEIYGLQSQIKNSAVSVPSNIAEGYGRRSTKSYAQFIKIARGSLYEFETQLIISHKLEFLKDEDFEKLSNLIVEESKMLNAFIKSLENKL